MYAANEFHDSDACILMLKSSYLKSAEWHMEILCLSI